MPDNKNQTTAAAAAAASKGTSILLGAAGKTTNFESIEDDGSFKFHKLVCSSAQLKGKFSSNGTAVELLLEVVAIDGHKTAGVKIFSVTDPTRHMIDLPARLPIAQPVKGLEKYGNVVLIDASFGRLKTTTGLLPGDDGIRMIEMRLPRDNDGNIVPMKTRDLWEWERSILNNPALAEANRRKAGARTKWNQFQNQSGFGAGFSSYQQQPTGFGFANAGGYGPVTPQLSNESDSNGEIDATKLGYFG